MDQIPYAYTLHYPCHTLKWRVNQDPTRISTREEPSLCPPLAGLGVFGSVSPDGPGASQKTWGCPFLPFFSSFVTISPPVPQPHLKGPPSKRTELVFRSPNQRTPSRWTFYSTLHLAGPSCCISAPSDRKLPEGRTLFS